MSADRRGPITAEGVRRTTQHLNPLRLSCSASRMSKSATPPVMRTSKRFSFNGFPTQGFLENRPLLCVVRTTERLRNQQGERLFESNS